MTTPHSRGGFATTQWSLVLAARERESTAGREALVRLCSRYWYPVFAYVRRRGHAREEAEDLTQEFFANLIEKSVLDAVDPERGRFRSFLLTACRNFLANDWDRRSARKRGGGNPLLSIDADGAEQRYARELAHGQTPEALYERQWTLTLLAQVLDELQDEYASTGRGRQFERLKRFLTAEDDAGTYAEAARDLETTEAAVKVAVHRLRARYRRALRATVAATIESEDDVNDEIAFCLRVLSRR